MLPTINFPIARFAHFLVAIVCLASAAAAERAHAADAKSQPVILALQTIPGPRSAAAAGAEKSHSTPPAVVLALPTPRPIHPATLKFRGASIRVSIGCSIDPVTGKWNCVRTVEGIEYVDD